MGNQMEFPKTFTEFADDYGFYDYKEEYTNGSHLIPVFRVEQWLDHLKQMILKVQTEYVGDMSATSFWEMRDKIREIIAPELNIGGNKE